MVKRRSCSHNLRAPRVRRFVVTWRATVIYLCVQSRRRFIRNLYKFGKVIFI